MGDERTAEPFPDNWTYLKAEIGWLDRVLMRALAQQKQVGKEIDRVARSAADRATSHWWKGFITLDAAKGGSQTSYKPSTEGSVHPLGRFGARLAASAERGIALALPLLCDRLQLGRFERDLLVLCLAPEISRRYEKLYAYLNEDDCGCRQPTVELALRLFCRSDTEWRLARAALHAKAPLVQNKILLLHPSPSSARSRLAQVLQLSEKAANYLLAEKDSLDTLLPKTRRRQAPPAKATQG